MAGPKNREAPSSRTSAGGGAITADGCDAAVTPTRMLDGPVALAGDSAFALGDVGGARRPGARSRRGPCWRPLGGSLLPCRCVRCEKMRREAHKPLAQSWLQ